MEISMDSKSMRLGSTPDSSDPFGLNWLCVFGGQFQVDLFRLECLIVFFTTRPLENISLVRDALKPTG